MQTAFSAIWLLFGFAMLLKAADWLVEGSCSLAKRAGVSELVVGLTLISFGTTMPEFFVNIVSRLQNDAGIAVGNAFGSVIANILLVLGVAASIRPISFRRKTLIWEIPFAFLTTIALAFLVWIEPFGRLTRFDGVVLLAIFALFLYYVYRFRSETPDTAAAKSIRQYSVARAFFMVVVAVPTLALGAEVVVDGASAIASALGVSQSVAGLTFVAIGTSLPELATSIFAAAKKRQDIAVGNVVGANILNICWILGMSSAVSPLMIPIENHFDIGLMVMATALLFVSIYFGKSGVLSRHSGILFVLLYVFYLASLALRPSNPANF